MSKPILITGPHRSGTTWVGRMIAQSPDLAYIDEPFNLNHRLGICNSQFNNWFQFICSENEDKYYESFAKTINFQYSLQAELGSIRSAKDLARMCRDYFKTNYSRYTKKVPLVKDPISFFSACWLQESFDMRVVNLIRHPAAFVNSIINAEWDFPFKDLLNQPLLITNHLDSFSSEINDFTINKRPLIDQAILLWNIFAKTTLSYKDKTDWLFIRHEDISTEPVSFFKTIFDYLELEYTLDIQNSIIASSSSVNPEKTLGVNSITIDSKKNINRWKDDLTKKQINLIKSNTSKFWSSFYKEEDW